MLSKEAASIHTASIIVLEWDLLKLAILSGMDSFKIIPIETVKVSKESLLSKGLYSLIKFMLSQTEKKEHRRPVQTDMLKGSRKASSLLFSPGGFPMRKFSLWFREGLTFTPVEVPAILRGTQLASRDPLYTCHGA